jgi:hypothetical protein
MPSIVLAVTFAVLAAFLLLAPDRHFRSGSRRLRRVGAGCLVLAAGVNVLILVGAV